MCFACWFYRDTDLYSLRARGKGNTKQKAAGKSYRNLSIVKVDAFTDPTKTRKRDRQVSKRRTELYDSGGVFWAGENEALLVTLDFLSSHETRDKSIYQTFYLHAYRFFMLVPPAKTVISVLRPWMASASRSFRVSWPSGCVAPAVGTTTTKRGRRGFATTANGGKSV